MKIPETATLKKLLKDAMTEIGVLTSELDECRYKNKVLIAKGKELEAKLNNEFSKADRERVFRETSREELYGNLKKKLEKKDKEIEKLRKSNNELIRQLLQKQNNEIQQDKV